MRPWILALSILTAWAASAVGPFSPVPTSIALAAGGFAYGAIVDTTNPRSMRLARDAGFTHAKMIIHWPSLEPKRGRYRWEETAQNDLDNVIKAARGGGLRLIVRVDGVPGWAGGSPANADLDAVTRFYEAMADHGKGTVVGYEILNEPNLPQEWGGPPDPAGYTAFVKAASRGVKRADRGAVVIGGGLSPATGGLGGTVDDLDFLRGMYAAGAGGTMDALAVHNYGGSSEPERDPRECGVCFRRAELYREIMLERGDAATPIWATEFGWLLDPGRGIGQYDWMKVSADRQAEYLVRAFRYARGNWPWMTGMLLSNLDASTSPYHQAPEDGMPWFAILNPDHSPRAAYRALKDMPKDSAGLPLPAEPVAARPAPPAPLPATAPAEDPTPPVGTVDNGAVWQEPPPPPFAFDDSDCGAPTEEFVQRPLDESWLMCAIKRDVEGQTYQFVSWGEIRRTSFQDYPVRCWTAPTDEAWTGERTEGIIAQVYAINVDGQQFVRFTYRIQLDGGFIDNCSQEILARP